MKRLLALPRLTAIVWISFVGLLALMVVMGVLGAWHPHFLPVTSVLAIFVSSGLALVLAALWRLIAGPRRLRALTCLLLGSAPLCFFAGYMGYGLKASYGRQVELTIPLKLLVPFAESIFDLLARVQYPQRTEGATVVMIAGPVANAREQVAAMDRHVWSLWQRLGGKRTTRRVHWVRGPIMGVDSHAIYGMCMGSRPGQFPPDAEGLTSLDRHEVAHCVIASFMPADINPPAALSEGWAEANMGRDPKSLAVQAWDHIEQGTALSLRELTGPTWYSRHHWPAYVQGAVLVNHILRAHGPAKFFQLYATCRPETFADDCQRVLGISLDQLDADYQAELEPIASCETTPAGRLRSMKVRPPVTQEAWNAFVDEYLERAPALIKPYEHVRMTVARTDQFKDEQGAPQSTKSQLTLLRSGELAAVRDTHPNYDDLWLATPRRSFFARRRAAGWENTDHSSGRERHAYRRALRRISELDPVQTDALLLLSLTEELRHNVTNPEAVVVTQLERSSGAGRPTVRVRFENPVHPPGAWRSITMTLATDEAYAGTGCEIELPDGTLLRSGIEYDRTGAQPLLRGNRFSVDGPRGTLRSGETRIVACTFGPIPEKEFTEARLFDAPVIHKPPESDDERYKDPATFADWYPVLFILGAVSIACGMMTGFLDRARTRRASETG
jgi:hypothetical protein